MKEEAAPGDRVTHAPELRLVVSDRAEQLFAEENLPATRNAR
jgi:hypothetical protein